MKYGKFITGLLPGSFNVQNINDQVISSTNIAAIKYVLVGPMFLFSRYVKPLYARGVNTFQKPRP